MMAHGLRQDTMKATLIIVLIQLAVVLNAHNESLSVNKINEGHGETGHASTTSTTTTVMKTASSNQEEEVMHGLIHQMVPFQAKRLRALDGATAVTSPQPTNVNRRQTQLEDDKKDTNRIVQNGASLDKCEFWFDGSVGGNVTSLAYPRPYPNNLDCRYRIPRLAADVCQLELRFHEFELALGETTEREGSKDNEEQDKRSSSEIKAVVLKDNLNEFNSPADAGNAAHEPRRRKRRQNDSNCLDADYLEFANGPKRYCGPDWKGRRDVVELTHGDSQFLFRFKSKHQQSSKGFHIEYRPIRNSCSESKSQEQPKARSYAEEVLRSLPTSASGCEERHTEMEFRIKSRNYPSNYSHNEDCVYYVLKAADEVCGLEVRFNRFHLEESEACAYDFVEVDGENFCGRLPNGSRNIFRFSGDVKTISFQTDGQMSAPGFDISVRQLKDCENTFMPTENRLLGESVRGNKCSIVRHDVVGRMTSMRFPEPYPRDSLCAYTIKRAQSTGERKYCSVELEFVNFDLQDTLECRADFLELENRRHCGRSLNATRRLVSFNDDGFVKFLFKSDLIDSNNVGFAINYTQVECLVRTIGNELDLKEGENVPQAYNVPQGFGHKLEPSVTARPQTESDAVNRSLFYRDPCYHLFTEKRFTLQSEVVNGTYRENSDCLYAVRKSSPNVCYIEMEFEKFDLEASAECQYDYVEIGNAVRLCGTLHRETSRIYVFDKDEFFIVFHTDASTEREGFLIKAEQLECKGDRIVRNDNFDVQVPPSERNDEIRHKRTGEEPRDNLQSLEQSRHENRQEQQEIERASGDTKGRLQQRPEQQQQQQEQQHEQQQEPHQLQQQETVSSDYDLLHDRVAHLPPSSLACSSIHSEREFFIHSPSYPGSYATELDCLHLIRPYSASVCKIEINFESFELQPYDFSKDCLKSDFIDIDGREAFCGKLHESQSKVYPFLNETFVIHFHSDTFKTSFDKGFRLFVRQIDCGEGNNFGAAQKFKNTGGSSIPRIYSRCNKLYSSSNFEIKSPNYPAYFASNTNCQYRVSKVRRPGGICFLEISFLNFELQDSFNCSKDFINFNGIKVCGTIAKDSVRLFPFWNDEFVIHFASDRLINGRFHFFARQADCSETISSQNYGGGGSGARLLPPPASTSFNEDDDSSGGRKTFPPRLLPPYIEKNDEDPFSNLAIFQTNQRCQRIVNSVVFELESPNYPNYYLPSLGCVYTIQRRHARICRLELHLLDFDVEPSVRCLADYLLVDGVKYCNTNRPDPIIILPFQELEKTISFQSVSLRRRKGFHIRGRQVECDPWSVTSKTSPPSWVQDDSDKKVIILPSLPSICEICVTEVTGAIQSYDYPNFYPGNVNCSYKITPLPGNCMLQIRFDEFDFDVTPACDLDFLQINGVRYCGNQLRGVSMVLLNKRKEDLTIRMITNSRRALLKPSFRGFRASYTQLPCLTPDGEETSTTRPQPSRPGSKTIHTPTRQQIQQYRINHSSDGHDEQSIRCDQNFDSKVFTIQSPGYPYRYFDGIDCNYRITKATPTVCRLKLTFQHFNVNGEDGFCRGDFLEVFGARICGVLERFTTKEVPFLPERMLLKFHTNRVGAANGFHIVGEQVDCLSFGQSKDNDDQTGKTQQHQDLLRYDDDEAMVSEGDHGKISSTTGASVTSTTMPSTTSMATKTMSMRMPTSSTTTTEAPNPVKVNVAPSVDYVDPVTPPSKRPMPSEDSKTSPGYPMRYYSHNITVMNREKSRKPADNDDGNFHGQQQITTSWESRNDQHHHTQQQMIDVPARESICDQGLMEKMYFELKGSQLRPAVDGQTVAGCQIRIKKAKPSICQLDIMFVRYNLDESTCGQQYLSVDGERICGHVPPSTIKKFWFIRSELILFAKLARPEDHSFEIKVRQVECAENVEQKTMMASKGHSMIEQRQQDHFEQQRHSMIEQKQQDHLEQQRHSMIEQKQQDHLEQQRHSMIEQKQQDHLEQQRHEQKNDGYDQQQQQKEMTPFEYPPSQLVKQQKWDSSYYDRAVQQQLSIDREQNLDYPTKKKVSPIKQFQMERKPSNADGYNLHCDIIENEGQFSITSPREGGPHRCRYTIRKASEAVCALDIRFDMFRLVDEGKCEREYMDIDSGKICGAFPVGHERRYYFLTNEYEKVIYFNSSLTHGNGDFKLHVKQVEDCQKPSSPKKPSLHTPTICEKNIRNVHGHLESPNYPAPYDELTRCTYRIQAMDEQYCRVRLMVRDLDIEVSHQQSSAKECDKDVLEFGGHKLCGQTSHNEREYELPFDMINGQKVVQLMFSSDATGSGRGFDIEYRQEVCSQSQQAMTMTSAGKGWRGNTAIHLVSPTNGYKGRFKSMQSPMAGQQQATNDNSLHPNPMRPNYPPNYVSKAHLTKTMDRKEFIKMFMMMEERDNRKVSLENTKDSEKMLSSSSTTTVSSVPSTTTSSMTPTMAMPGTSTLSSMSTTTTEAPSTTMMSMAEIPLKVTTPMIMNMSSMMETTTAPAEVTTSSIIS